MFVRYALVCALAAGLSRGQSSLPSDGWLMKNYHFTGPPPPGTVRPVDPVISELWRIENAATSYWVDGSMLNYITLQGSHLIVRLDLVDRNLSNELNRQQKVEFRLPQ